jgi:hypothetical protein
MRFRKLRIAWTVFCGIACALLIVLWVRSYSWNDSLFKRLGTREFVIQISRGDLGIWFTPTKPSQAPSDDTQWSIGKDRPADASAYFMLDGASIRPVPDQFGFYYGSTPQNTVAWIPFYATVLAVAVAAGVPWLWRFSLRTLLIVTTLIALVLGLVVYASNG